ncbi:MAG TPA: GNAT family N-acetyltransferase [Gaiella sp.]|nr:GNAT family N-acetyltransferase [Gaiella sp.]
MAFAGGAEPIRSRWTAAPDHAFKAVLDGELVGSAFVARWGSFAVFGPLTVRPDVWERGIGSRLWDACLPVVDGWGVSQTGLFTFPQSTKHVHLYRKHGFWPRFLTALTEKPLAGAALPFETVPALERSARREALEACREVAGAIFAGLDLTSEIEAVATQGVGDTVLVRDAAAVAGFAVCHVGTGSEAVRQTCFVKFAAVRPGSDGEPLLGALLDACEGFAMARGAARLEVGVSLARERAARVLAERGHRTFRQGVAMHRPNAEGFNRPDALVLDDWR